MTETATETTGTKKGNAAKTNYVVLATRDSGATWTVEGRQVATSKASALSHFYESRPLPEGAEIPPVTEGAAPEVHDVLFQAVPASSWKALRPATPRPRLPFSEAD